MRRIFARRAPQSGFEAVCHEIFVDYDVRSVAIFASKSTLPPRTRTVPVFFNQPEVSLHSRPTTMVVAGHRFTPGNN
jgi:hypothetical protein